MDRKPDTSGPDAPRPYHVPLKGAWQIMKRVGSKIVNDNLQVVTAGCAFYALFAIFPALWASVSLFGLTTDADTVDTQFGMLATVLPAQAYEIVIGEIRRIAETPHKALGWNFAAGLGIALWSANLGTHAMFSALNIAYGEPEHRGVLRLYLSAFVCTILGILGILAMLFAVVYVPILFSDTGHAGAFETIVRVGRWPFLALLVMSLLALIYRFGPSRRGAEWRWISVGAIFATIVWLLASAGFSYYVSHFASNYDRMYGSLGAVIVLLFWLYLTFFIVLVGAEINAVLELETEQNPPAVKGAAT
jgi:membrane protein